MMFFKRKKLEPTKQENDLQQSTAMKDLHDTQTKVDESFEKLFGLMAETLVELSSTPSALTNKNAQVELGVTKPAKRKRQSATKGKTT